jgi:hypothetical protein
MGYKLNEIVNMDETAVNYASGVKYQYICSGLSRATQHLNVDDKPRLTALITVAANGCQLPGFFILKHGKSSHDEPDQTGMRVISNLHKEVGFRKEDGWTEQVWEKIIVEPESKSYVTHRVRYIFHRDNFHVITSQVNAWNDQIRMLMYVDKLCLWMDNFKVHATDANLNNMILNGIYPAFYPENMTDKLQVCDSVVNALIKSTLKKLRASITYEAMQQSRSSFDSLSPEQQCDYVLQIPKPKISDALQSVIQLINPCGPFHTNKFMKSVQDCFVSTGCAPIDGDLSKGFRKYQGHDDAIPITSVHMPSVPERTKICTNSTFQTSESIVAKFRTIKSESSDELPESIPSSQIMSNGKGMLDDIIADYEDNEEIDPTFDENDIEQDDYDDDEYLSEGDDFYFEELVDENSDNELIRNYQLHCQRDDI